MAINQKIDNSSEIDLYYDNTSTSSQNKSYQMQISMDFVLNRLLSKRSKSIRLTL